MRKQTFLTAGIFALFILLVIAEYSKPKPIDWSQTFSKDDKIPYGNKVMFDLLDDIFPGQEVEVIYQPVYNQIKENSKEEQDVEEQSQDNNSEQINYLFINRQFYPNELDVEKLLQYVAAGNNAFIAVNEIDEILADTLHIELESNFILHWQEQKDSNAIGFVHRELQPDSAYLFKEFAAYPSFASFDTINSQVLGFNKHDEVNFIKTGFGRGFFYLHSNPLVFTNYYMVDKHNVNYISGALSHLPSAKVWWDEYYKVGRLEAKTSLRYLLSTEVLKWAMYLFLLGMFLFLVFESKRKQRIIPVMEPLKNTSIDFAKTVGSLYYQNGDHKDIADKKINFFQDYIRNKYFISKIDFNRAFYQRLSNKSVIDIESIERLFKIIIIVRTHDIITESDLMYLNKQLELFYQKGK